MDNPLDDYILAAVKTAWRNYQRGVLPRMIQPLLPVTLSEQRVRLYMVRLWRMGKLVRIGADGQSLTRRGYRVPNQIEARLYEMLHKECLGVRECEIRRYANSPDIDEYLVQLEASGQVVRRWGDVRLRSLPEKRFLENKYLYVA